MTLPPYVQYCACDKCGVHSEHPTRYRPAEHPMFSDGTRLAQIEHLQRECRNCGYRWAEATVEAQP